MYIKNRRNSSEIKVCSPLKLSWVLIGMKPENGYYSYAIVRRNGVKIFFNEVVDNERKKRL